MTRTVADFITETLQQAGVKRVFGVVAIPSTGLPMPCAARSRSSGSICAMRSPLLLPPGPRPI